MPYLNLVHLRDVVCTLCTDVPARAGARSFVVNESGDPVNFSADDPPAEMVVRMECRNGHLVELTVPNEISAEEALMTPDDAPIGADACIVSGTSESGKQLP